MNCKYKTVRDWPSCFEDCDYAGTDNCPNHNDALAQKIGEIGRQGYNKVIWQACAMCGKERWVQIIRGIPTTTLCHLCSITGSNGPGWKGGRRIDSHGYISIYLYSDDFFYPMARKSHAVYEHRLVVAKVLGRCLHSWEIVHHKGDKYPKGSREDKADNRYPENLQLVTDDRHKQITILENRIKRLEQRVLLLEAENILLKKGEMNEPHKDRMV